MSEQPQNFGFGEDETMLRDSAQKFFADNCSPDKIHSQVAHDSNIHRDIECIWDKNLWQQIVELGWTGMAIPEAYGGLGLGYLELCVIAEELGRALAPVPFSSSVYLATESLLLAGSEAQKQRYLPQLAAGNLVGTLATAITHNSR